MKRITKEELPEILSNDIVEVLIEMALEFPQTKEWHEVFDILDERGQLKSILDKVDERQKAIKQTKEEAKSQEQKIKEKREWQEFLKNVDPEKFYGNMGEPETPQQYKDKYGIWPPGYDKNGNKIQR